MISVKSGNIISAALEGLAAGNNIKPFFAKLKAPAYAPPLWLWIIIGIGYYVMCFFILFRIFHTKATIRLDIFR